MQVVYPTGHGSKQPKGDGGPRVAGKADFTSEAAKMRYRLRGDVIKVDYMTDRVQHREEERCARSDLVKLYVGVDRYILLDRKFLQLCQ